MKKAKAPCKNCKKWKGGEPSGCPYAAIDFAGNCEGFEPKERKTGFKVQVWKNGGDWHE